MTWMAVVIFDSSEMRNLMHDALHISMAGPYLLYWVAMGDMFMSAEWANWVWYTMLIIMLFYSAASILFQAIFIPKVTNWLETTPIKIYETSDDMKIEPQNDVPEEEEAAADSTADTTADETNTDADADFIANLLAIGF